MRAIEFSVSEFRTDKASQATLADTYAQLKVLTDNVKSAMTELKNEFVKRGLEFVQGNECAIKVSHISGGMRYDSKKLDAYFQENSIDTKQFKTEQSEQVRLTIKPV